MTHASDAMPFTRYFLSVIMTTIAQNSLNHEYHVDEQTEPYVWGRHQTSIDSRRGAVVERVICHRANFCESSKIIQCKFIQSELGTWIKTYLYLFYEAKKRCEGRHCFFPLCSGFLDIFHRWCHFWWQTLSNWTPYNCGDDHRFDEKMEKRQHLIEYPRFNDLFRNEKKVFDVNTDNDLIWQPSSQY